MRLLLTGACGFVGSTLAAAFRDAWPDWELIGLDNLSRPGSEMNRQPLRTRGVRLFHGDLRNRSDLEGLPQCDWVIDAAANPSVLAGIDGQSSSRQLIEHNLFGTVQLLELARTWRSGFIMLSTSRVYSIRSLSALPVEARGDRFVPKPDNQPGAGPAGVNEAFSTEPPLSLYGASKRASELLACEYGAAFGVPVFLNRCGVLTGAGQFGKIDQGIFSFWIRAWERKRPLKYIGFDGQGRQVRDCLHARDLAPLLSKQIQKPGTPAPAIINVSGGLSSSASLRELSAWCEQRLGPGTVASQPESRPFDVPWLVLDSMLAETTWGWKPQTPREAIWEEIAQHAQQHPHWHDLAAS